VLDRIKIYGLINDYHPEQILSEFLNFLFWLQNFPLQTILEIGLFRGGATRCFLDVFPEAELWAVDSDPTLLPPDIRSNLDAEDRCTLVWGDSHKQSTIEQISARLYDFIFIDGDHSYEGVKSDYEIYSRVLSPFGILALHDIKDTQRHRDRACEVSKLWKELKEGHTTIEFLNNRSQNASWGGIGVLL